jgi:biopolymer transport protein ExbD
MKLGSPLGHKKARIEIIPLIDIMFFLLASFMMVSLSQVHMKGMKGITLPLGQKGEVQNKKDYISVSVDVNGNVYFDKTEMSYDELAKKLKTVHDENPEAKVFVRGDAATAHGNIIQVLERLRLVGFYKIAFEIKSEAGKGIPGPREGP